VTAGFRRGFNTSGIPHFQRVPFFFPEDAARHWSSIFRLPDMRAGNGRRDSAHDQHRTHDCRYAFTVTGLHADVYFPGFYTISPGGIGTTRDTMPSRPAPGKISLNASFATMRDRKAEDPFASVQLCNREQQLGGQTIVGYESFYPLSRAHRGSIRLPPR
jgi:hypothetical protein